MYYTVEEDSDFQRTPFTKKLFVGRVRPGPTGKLTALPKLHNWIGEAPGAVSMDSGECRGEGSREEKDGKSVKEKGRGRMGGRRRHRIGWGYTCSLRP